MTSQMEKCILLATYSNIIKLKIKSVAYSSQGSHTGQLDSNIMRSLNMDTNP